MKLIPLSARNKCKNAGKYFAEVDDEIYPFLIHWDWRVAKTGKNTYACRMATIDGVRTSIFMHRFILGVSDSSICVDHINNNGLCNLTSNLRTCSKGENSRNRSGWMKSTSQFKGVTWIANKQKRVKRWTASITIDRRKICIGYFGSEIEAAHAYDAAAKQHHGEFAKLNFEE